MKSFRLRLVCAVLVAALLTLCGSISSFAAGQYFEVTYPGSKHTNELVTTSRIVFGFPTG